MKAGTSAVRAALLLTLLRVGAAVDDCYATTDGNTYSPVYIAANTSCVTEAGATPNEATLPCDCAVAAEAAGMNSFTFTEGVCKLYPRVAQPVEGGDVKVYTVAERLENSVPVTAITVDPELFNNNEHIDYGYVLFEVVDLCAEVGTLEVFYNNNTGVYGTSTLLPRYSSYKNGKKEIEDEELCISDSIRLALHNSDGEELASDSWNNPRLYDSFYGVDTSVTIGSFLHGSYYYCTFFTDIKKTYSEAVEACAGHDNNRIYDRGLSDDVIDSITVYKDSWVDLKNPLNGSEFYVWKEDYYSTIVDFTDSLWLNPADVPTKECAYFTSDASGLRLRAADCSEEHYLMCIQR